MIGGTIEGTIVAYKLISQCLEIITNLSGKLEMLKDSRPAQNPSKEKDFTANELESKLMDLRDVIRDLDNSVCVYESKG